MLSFVEWSRELHKLWMRRKSPSLSILFCKNKPSFWSLTGPLFSLGCCCCSVTKLCSILCNPMNCSMPGLPVLQYFPEFTQTHAYWVSNAIQLSHPYLFLLLPQSFPESGSFLVSCLFTLHGQSIGSSASASVLSVNIQGWFPLRLTGLPPCCPRDSQEPSPDTPAIR